eukprot:189812-Amphidinium_carterae.1
MLAHSAQWRACVSVDPVHVWWLSVTCTLHAPSGDVEYSPKKIAMNYIRSWFCLDCTLAAIDWSILIMVSLLQQYSQSECSNWLDNVMMETQARMLTVPCSTTMLGVHRQPWKALLVYQHAPLRAIEC